MFYRHHRGRNADPSLLIWATGKGARRPPSGIVMAGMSGDGNNGPHGIRGVRVGRWVCDRRHMVRLESIGEDAGKTWTAVGVAGRIPVGVALRSYSPISMAAEGRDDSILAVGRGLIDENRRVQSQVLSCSRSDSCHKHPTNAY